MTATVSEAGSANQASATAAVPKRITNAQTVCNEKNAKGKLCNGHLKQLNTAGEAASILPGLPPPVFIGPGQRRSAPLPG